MAIRLEFIDLVVPIHVIEEKYPGRFAGCLRDHANLIGGRVWYDEFLFRDGAMNPDDIQHLVRRWENRGFGTVVERDGVRSWDEVCVVEVIFGGPTLPCD